MRRFILRNDAIRQRAAEFIASFEPDDGKLYECVARPVKSRRSLEQNAYLHKLLHDIADFIGDDIESIKLEMKAKFLEPVKVVGLPDGSKAAVYPSTADMSVREMAEFCERIEAWAVRELGFRRVWM